MRGKGGKSEGEEEGDISEATLRYYCRPVAV